MTHTKSHKLTHAFVKSLPIPADGRPAYYDRTIAGFGIRISPGGAKTWFLHKRVKGHAQLKTLGRFPGLTEPDARKAAHKLLGDIAIGRDPSQERKDAKAEAAKKKAGGYTLQEALDDFKDARQKTMRAQTLHRYSMSLNTCLSDWLKSPVASISRDMVLARHRHLTKTRGEASANKVFRELSALYNYARIKKKENGVQILPENPVRALADEKRWNKNRSRDGIIKEHEMPEFWKAARSLGDGLVDDLLVVLTLTGLRLSEGRNLSWEHVDLTGRTLHIPNPKNDEPHTLPLGNFLTTLLKKRRLLTGESDWVFPTSTGGPVTGVAEKKATVCAAFGRDFMLHDLRRTFQTTAESLDLPWLVCKRLLNHSTKSDITAGYTYKDIDRLRDPMQQIEDEVLMRAGLKPRPKGKEADNASQ